MSTPSFLAYSGSRACSASMNAARPPVLLRLGDDLEGQGRLARRLGPEDLDDAAAGHAADAERGVDGDGAGRRSHWIASCGLVAEAHDRALAELAVDLLERLLQRLELVLVDDGHGGSRFLREDGGL